MKVSRAGRTGAPESGTSAGTSAGSPTANRNINSLPSPRLHPTVVSVPFRRGTWGTCQGQSSSGVYDWRAAETLFDWLGQPTLRGKAVRRRWQRGQPLDPLCPTTRCACRRVPVHRTIQSGQGSPRHVQSTVLVSWLTKLPAHGGLAAAYWDPLARRSEPAVVRSRTRCAQCTSEETWLNNSASGRACGPSVFGARPRDTGTDSGPPHRPVPTPRLEGEKETTGLSDPQRTRSLRADRRGFLVSDL